MGFLKIILHVQYHLSSSYVVASLTITTHNINHEVHSCSHLESLVDSMHIQADSWYLLTHVGLLHLRTYNCMDEHLELRLLYSPIFCFRHHRIFNRDIGFYRENWCNSTFQFSFISRQVLHFLLIISFSGISSLSWFLSL